MSWRAPLLRAARRQRLLITVLVGLALIDAVLVLAAPWPLGIIADDVLGTNRPPGWLSGAATDVGLGSRRSLVLLLALSIVVVYVAQQLVTVLTAYLNTRLSRRLNHAVGAEVLEALYRRTEPSFVRLSIGDMTSRVINDAKAGQDLVVGVAIPTLSAVVSLGLMLAVMVRLQPALTLVALVLVVPLTVQLHRHTKRMTEREHHRSKTEGEIWSHAEQMLGAVVEIQSATAEDRGRATFATAVDRHIEAQNLSEYAEIGFNRSIGVIQALGLGAMLALGGMLVSGGRLTIGELVVFNAYLGSFYGPLNSIALLAPSWASVVARGRRVLEVVECGEVIVERRDPLRLGGPLRGHVRFEHVSFSYEAGQEVLSDVCVDIEPGETVALVGATGSGKTTLVSLLPRFMDPTGGRVTVDGFDVRDLALADLRRNIAIVRQDPLLLPTTIAQNIAFARPDATFDEVRAAARAANATEFIDRLPEGFETVVGERGDTLSGGQKQRIAIARALLKDAPVLVLDEPTSALDPQTEHLLVVALERLTRNRTVIVIAHRESTIAHADRVVTLDRGRLTTPTAA